MKVHEPELQLEGIPENARGTVYFVIGTVVSEECFDTVVGQSENYGESAKIAPYEGVVAIPEEVFLAAARDLLENRAI